MKKGNLKLVLERLESLGIWEIVKDPDFESSWVRVDSKRFRGISVWENPGSKERGLKLVIYFHDMGNDTYSFMIICKENGKPLASATQVVPEENLQDCLNSALADFR